MGISSCTAQSFLHQWHGDDKRRSTGLLRRLPMQCHGKRLLNDLRLRQQLRLKRFLPGRSVCSQVRCRTTLRCQQPMPERIDMQQWYLSSGADAGEIQRLDHEKNPSVPKRRRYHEHRQQGVLWPVRVQRGCNRVSRQLQPQRGVQPWLCLHE